MDWTEGTQFALAALGFFLAGVLKGTTGLGYSSCALPFLVSALGLKTAIAMLVIPAMLSNVLLMLNTGHFGEALRRFWPLYAAMLTVTYAVLALSRPTLGLAERPSRALRVPVGFVNGRAATDPRVVLPRHRHRAAARHGVRAGGPALTGGRGLGIRGRAAPISGPSRAPSGRRRGRSTARGDLR
jgi:uncharacterized membrane protein YfcA